MNNSQDTAHTNSAVVRAIDFLDDDGSVVKSALRLADATLSMLEKKGRGTVSLQGLKGASSSYFNVFLRRIDEVCGVKEIGRSIQLIFGSQIQELVYKRSLEAIKGGSQLPQEAAESREDSVSESRSSMIDWLRVIAAKCKPE